MLLSFNKFNVQFPHCLHLSLYQSVEEKVVGENSKILPQLRSQLQFVSPIIYRFVCIQYHVIVSSVSETRKLRFS